MKKVKKNKITFFVTGPDAPYSDDFWNKVEMDEWEDRTYRIFDVLLSKNHSYIDMGAWIGPTVLYACQLVQHCYALEPDPVAFNALTDNISLNPNLINKITLYNGCIWNVSEYVKLGTKTDFGDSRSSILFANSQSSIDVKSLTLDDFIKVNDIKNCNFIKIDIEGGEAIVLPNIKSYLQRNKPTLLLSLHPFAFNDKKNDLEAILDVLKIYKNIYNTNGRPLKLHQLFNILYSLEKDSFSVVTTDRWDYLKRLSYILKIYKQAIIKRLILRSKSANK